MVIFYVVDSIVAFYRYHITFYKG